jgi:hypothetical protein
MSKNHNFTPTSLGFATHSRPSHQSISTRARALWRQHRCPSGHDLAIWLQAERLLTAAARRPPLSIRQRLRAGYAPLLRSRRSATSL